MSHRVTHPNAPLSGSSNSSAHSRQGYQLVSDREPLITNDEEMPQLAFPESKVKPVFVPSWSQWTSEIVHSMIFQTVMGLAILANALVIGFETDYPEFRYWALIEGFFLILFALELFARLASAGIVKFFSIYTDDVVWNTFDFVIVVLGLADAVAELLAPKSSEAGGEATLFRMVRLFRIVRIFKIIRFLKQLYLLAHGFIEAAQSVFWVTFLMVFVHYVCSIVLVRTVGHLPETDEHHEFLHEQYGTILKAMLSLFDLMSQPDMHPYHGMRGAYPLFTVFLMCWIIFGSFGMIALLTGVISESMFEKNGLRIDAERLEREQKRNLLDSKLNDIYDRMKEEASDDHGDVSVVQVLGVLPEVGTTFDQVEIAYTKHDMHSIVNIMDADESGSISKEEFVHGLVSIAEEIRPMSIAELFHCVQLVKSRVAKCQSQLGLSNAIHEHTCKHLEKLDKKFNDFAAAQLQCSRDTSQMMETIQSLASGLSQQPVLGVPAVDSRDSGLATKLGVCEQGILETRDIVSDLQNRLKMSVSEQVARETKDIVSDLQRQLRKVVGDMQGDQVAFRSEGRSVNEGLQGRAIFQAAVSEMEAKVIILKSAYKEAEQELRSLESIRLVDTQPLTSSSETTSHGGRDFSEGALQPSELICSAKSSAKSSAHSNHSGSANELQDRTASRKLNTPTRGK